VKTILELSTELREEQTTSRALVEQALERIDDPSGEGKRTFTIVYREAALAQANAVDELRANGIELSPLAGLPVSIKDLFDVAGETTTAGSRVLQGAPPADHDAPVVARLRAAGAVIVGKTNMTEFAFAAVGTNDTYGTPRNPFDRATARIPGGSSSGAAVSVTDGMAVVGIGSDTGGSVRIPAALCGLVGFKPTAHRIPTAGAIPLSTTLDSIGPLARSVTDCALVDAALAGRAYAVPEPLPIGRLRFAVPTNFMLEDLEEVVAQAFERAVERLTKAGARIESKRIEAFEMMPEMLAKGGFSGPEAAFWHAPLIEKHRELYDRRILARILSGGEQLASEYVRLLGQRRRYIARYAEELEGYDALLCPTVPIVASPIAEVEDDDAWARTNNLLLRNPRAVNFLDGCALTLPIHEPGSAPVGMMVVGQRDEDFRLLRIGRSIEAVFKATAS
jgi:aspartyl-tRNA(Asn)/glutamyl-tRNA(Gln) amidotransferase subunit A